MAVMHRVSVSEKEVKMPSDPVRNYILHALYLFIMFTIINTQKYCCYDRKMVSLQEIELYGMYL